MDDYQRLLKEEYKRYMNELRYLCLTGQITDEEYLKEMIFIDNAYKRDVVKRYNKTKIEKIKNIIVIAICLISMCIYFAHVGKNWECYSTIARNDLLTRLNEGEQDAYVHYRDNYINRDIYLYDGELTLTMLANRYGLDAKETINAFHASGYEHVQDWFDDELKSKLIQ